MIKFKRIVAVTLMASMLLFTGCTKKDEVALKVGDEQVSYDLYKQYLAVYENVTKAQYGEEAFNQEVEGKTLSDLLKENLVDMLSTQSMIESYMVENGYKADEEKIKEEIAKLKTSLDAQPEMKAIYTDSKVTDAFYEEQVRGTLLNEAFNEHLKKQVETGEAYKDKIDEYYNSETFVKARHILVKGEGEALKLKGELEQGFDTFENYASIHSLDPGSKAKGGDLGYFGKGQMVPAFDEAAFTLEIGKVSDPIQTDYGYHLILVEDRKNIKEMMDAGVEASIVDPLKEAVLYPFMGEEYDKILTSLKEKYKVENFIAELDAKYAPKEDKKDDAKEDTKAEGDTQAADDKASEEKPADKKDN